MTAESNLKLASCPRCPGTILAGWAEGLFWRLDPFWVTRQDAGVLKHHGVPVLVADWVANTWQAGPWHPGQHDLDKPNRYLVVPHVCGSAHARQETM